MFGLGLLTVEGFGFFSIPFHCTGVKSSELTMRYLTTKRLSSLISHIYNLIYIMVVAAGVRRVQIEPQSMKTYEERKHKNP